MLALDERELANVRGSTDRHDLPGADDRARPGLYDRPADRRDGDAARGHARGKRATTARSRLLQLVKVPSPERRLNSYPHELSGGLRQRAMIAHRAVVPAPRCCWPTSRRRRSTRRCRFRCLIAVAQAAAGIRHGADFRDARSRRRGADRRPGRRDVCGTHRRVGQRARRAAESAPSLHDGHAGLDRARPRCAARDIEAIPGSPPDLRALPAGLQLCAALQIRARAPAARPVPRLARSRPDHIACCTLVDDCRRASLGRTAAAFLVIGAKRRTSAKERCPWTSKSKIRDRASLRPQCDDPEHAAARHLEQGAPEIRSAAA